MGEGSARPRPEAREGRADGVEVGVHALVGAQALGANLHFPLHQAILDHGAHRAGPAEAAALVSDEHHALLPGERIVGGGVFGEGIHHQVLRQLRLEALGDGLFELLNHR
ncbi:hypothetical protein D3C87_1732770 [compost metagenome]